MREKMKNHAKYMHKYKNKNVQYKLYFTHTIFSKFYLYLKNLGFSSSPPFYFSPLSGKCYPPILAYFLLAIPSFQDTGGENTLSLTKPYPFGMPVTTRVAYVWGTNNFNMETFSWQKHLQHSHFELYKLSNISKKSITCWVS